MTEKLYRLVTSHLCVTLPIDTLLYIVPSAIFLLFSFLYIG